MEKSRENFNKINKEIQPELDLNFEEIPKTSETAPEELNEIEIPSFEELENLKETDMAGYLLLMDAISKQEGRKHEKEMEELARLEEIKNIEERERLYKNETPEERYNSHLYGQD